MSVHDYVFGSFSCSINIIASASLTNYIRDVIISFSLLLFDNDDYDVSTHHCCLRRDKKDNNNKNNNNNSDHAQLIKPLLNSKE